jgi:hypothetical protein
MTSTTFMKRLFGSFKHKSPKKAQEVMKKHRRSILLETLERREVFASGDLLISEFLANPAGSDTNQEYVELIATKAIDFSVTPYSVAFTNNGTATANGWIAGGNISYGFNITSGVVAPGDVVYVGGSGMAPTGTKLRVIDVTTTPGDGFGNLQATGGVLGNGGSNADGIAVFDVDITAVTPSTVPIDGIFFGTGMGTAVVAGGADGYQLPVNDRYAGGKAQSTSFVAPDPGALALIATGTYNTLSSNFSTIRTWAGAAATATSEISLTGSAGPEVNVIGNGVNIVDGDVTPSLADFTKFNATLVGGNSSRSFTIQNTGTSSLSLGSFSSSNPAFTIPGPLPGSIAAGGSINISIVFTPTSTALATSTISFVNGDSNENPYDFDVSGLGATAVTSAVAINELRMRDSVNDNVSNNFLEIFANGGAGNRSLAGLTLVALSSEFNPGLVNFAVDLSSAVTDANGFVLIADDGTTATVDPGDVIRSDFDLFDTPSTFLIVSGFTGTEGSDLDLDNIGGLDTTPWTAIIDSISLDRSTLASQNYSPTIVASPDADAPAGVRRVPNGTGAYEILSFTSNALDTPGSSNTSTGILLTQSGGTTVVVEDGATDTFDIRLLSEPTSNVTISITITDGQTTVNTGTLTFTPTSGATPWNVAQTVTVTAVNDVVNEGPHSGTINFGVASADASYNNFAIAPVNVSIADNDGPALTQLLLNEIHINPPGTDTGSEFIEFRGTPGATIPSNYYLVSIEGDGGLGVVDKVFSLGGMAIGSNGYLVLLQAGNTYATSVGSSVVTATGTGWGTAFSSNVGDLENGSNSFLLIQSATAPVDAADVDVAGDGILSGDALGWTIIDSIGNMDGGASDTGYARTNFSTNGTGIVAAPNTIVNLTTLTNIDGFTPDYLARNGNTTGQLEADWVASDTLGTAPNFTIDAAEVTPNTISGSLNHIGSTNVFGAVAAAPKVESIVFGNGPQRSMITSIKVTFDSDVTLDANAFVLETSSINGGGVFAPVAFTVNQGAPVLVAGKTEVTLTFSGAGISGGSLADGNYHITALSSRIRSTVGGIALDGDNNGSAGGDFIEGESATDNFFRLFGDSDGNGVMNPIETNRFRATVGRSTGDPAFNALFDFDANGSITPADTNQFRQRVGKTRAF